jgi:hypothetical protein
VIYTINAIESINAQLRKIIKTRGHFPTDDAATKLIWLGLRNITANWGSAAHDWKSAMINLRFCTEIDLSGQPGKSTACLTAGRYRPAHKKLTVLPQRAPLPFLLPHSIRRRSEQPQM